MKIKIEKRVIFIALLFMAGLSLLLYPFVANQWNSYRQSKLISSYDEQVAQMEASGEIDYSRQWQKADEYNQSLKPAILPDSFAVAAASEENEQYMSCLNLTDDGMMGYVEIPKINVKLPIFHTTEEEVLQQAAGHLEGSSLPVGGEDTHTVISAHRGLPSAALFTDLDKLAEGDHFLLYILDDVLCYQVDRITVVEPEDTSALSVEEGQDFATLLTCTPYGINSHRLLVRGRRTEYVESVMEEVPKSLLGISVHTSYLLWIIVGLAVTGAVIGILYAKEKKRKRTIPPAEESAAENPAPASREYAEYKDNGDYADFKEYTDDGTYRDYKEHTDEGKYENPGLEREKEG